MAVEKHRVRPADETCPIDPLWLAIRAEVKKFAVREPMLASFLHATILNHNKLEDALSYLLAQKLASADIPAMSIREVVDESLAADPAIGAAVCTTFIRKASVPGARGCSVSA